MSTHPVCPVRIGATTRPSPALVLIYTRGLKSQDLRKRIMPLRQLGTLGVEAAARKMVEAHSEYLSPEKISFDQIVRLVASVVQQQKETPAPAPEPPAAAKEEKKAEAKKAESPSPAASEEKKSETPGSAIPVAAADKPREPRVFTGTIVTTPRGEATNAAAPSAAEAAGGPSPAPLSRGFLTEIACDLDSSDDDNGVAPQGEDDDDNNSVVSVELPDEMPITASYTPPPIEPPSGGDAAAAAVTTTTKTATLDVDDFDEEEDVEDEPIDISEPTTAPAPAAKPPPPKLAPIGGAKLTPLTGAGAGALAPLGGPKPRSSLPPSSSLASGDSSVSNPPPPRAVSFNEQAKAKTASNFADEAIDIVDDFDDDEEDEAEGSINDSLRAFVSKGYDEAASPATSGFVQTRLAASPAATNPFKEGMSRRTPGGLSAAATRREVAEYDDFEEIESDDEDERVVTPELPDEDEEQDKWPTRKDTVVAAGSPTKPQKPFDAEEDDVLSPLKKPSTAAAASKKGEEKAPESPGWRHPTMQELLGDSEESDDFDNGEALLGKGTSSTINNLLEGRTLGQAFRRPVENPNIAAVGVLPPANAGQMPLGPIASRNAALAGRGPPLGPVGGSKPSLAPLSGIGGTRSFR